MRTDFYVYIVFRPNWMPCYVGKGQGNRWKVHLRCSPNPHLRAIVALADGQVHVVKVYEGLTDEQACQLEVDLIWLIGREMRGGSLVNQTDGGDGVVGRSPEGCARIAAAHRGTRATEETREKMKISQKKRFVKSGGQTLETRKKISSGHIGIVPGEVTRLKMSKSAKARGSWWIGRVHTEETKSKLRAIKNGVALSDEHKAAIKRGLAARRAALYNLGNTSKGDAT